MEIDNMNKSYFIDYKMITNTEKEKLTDIIKMTQPVKRVKFKSYSNNFKNMIDKRSHDDFDVNKSNENFHKKDLITNDNANNSNSNIENQSLTDSCSENFVKIVKLEVKQKIKILLVDDSELMRKSNIRAFNKIENFNSNFEIIEGKDGIDILKYIMDDQKQENQINLILSDENMQYLQGSKAYSILKELEYHNKIQKIKKFSLTAFSDEATLLEMKNNGSDEIFNKPLTLKVAKSILERISNLNSKL
jgi:CheY-like chemotaxis protein